ncbi:MAG: MmgE/PrpD family protein [Clostridiales bacterium]|nr:MmgE/PrpD family protein [Clostridiales bacterium]
MISREFAKFINAITYDALPENVRELAKVSLLDYISCTLAGSRSEIEPIFMDLVDELGGNAQASIYGTNVKSSVVNAALVNAAYAHVLEMDDIHRLAMYHPGIVVLPAALAIAERDKLSGKQLIEGILAGYEVGIRIGVAINPSHFKIWHTTGTVGAFSAASSAGKLMGLSVDELTNALGNAGSMAAGLWQFNIDASMTKPLHPGKASVNGILACMLAKRGFTGAENIIEGAKGFGTAMSEAPDYDFMIRDLGKVYEFLGIGIKIHSGCRHTSSSVDGALALRNAHQIKPEEIERIHSKTYELGMDLCGAIFPQNIPQAKFSIAYCVACAFAFGRCSMEEMNMDVVQSDAIQELLKKTTVSVDEGLERDFPMGYASIVEVTLKDGRTFSEFTPHCTGDPENPVSIDVMKDRFISMTNGIISNDSQTNILRLVDDLEQMQDINELIRYLC